MTTASLLTRSTIRAASMLGLDDEELGRAIGVSVNEIDDLRREARLIDQGTDAGGRGLLLIRLLQALDSLVGANPKLRGDWLRAFDQGVGATPITLLSTPAGLTKVVEHLESRVSR
ncbi:MAG: hypothetical protein ACK4F6_17825 [Hylemonella sp.]